MNFKELTAVETDAVAGGVDYWAMLEAAAQAAKQAAIEAAKAAAWLNEQISA